MVDPRQRAGATLLPASCVLLGAAAILIRGPSGAGKSSLCHTLLANPAPFPFVSLIGDDQIWVYPASGRLIGEPPPALAGKLELRGLGIIPVSFERRGRIALVADLVPADEMERLPEEDELSTTLCGITLPRLAVPASGPQHQACAARLRQAMAWIAGGRELADLTR